MMLGDQYRFRKYWEIQELIKLRAVMRKEIVSNCLRTVMVLVIMLIGLHIKTNNFGHTIMKTAIIVKMIQKTRLQIC